MQLFITEFNRDWNYININEARILHQLNNVLRAKPWYIFFVQNYENKEVQRFKLEIISIKKDNICAQIIEKTSRSVEKQNFGMIICLPNKFEKIELIIQKLTEIGIPQIVLYPSQRSVIQTINEAKLQRLEKIKIEAAEQSRNFVLPEIHILKSNEITNFIQDKNLIIFDANGKDLGDIKMEKQNLYGIVWPEWWFDEKDLKIFADKIIVRINLGESILRTETGSIIWWWIIKNL